MTRISIVIFSTVLSFGSIQAWALKPTCEEFQLTGSVEKFVSGIEADPQLKTPAGERSTIRDFTLMRVKNPVKFALMLSKSGENGEVHQSYLEEVQESASEITKKERDITGRNFNLEAVKKSSIFKAKALAKYMMFESIRKNWGELGNSIFNEDAISEWGEAVPMVKRILQNKMLYLPKAAEDKGSFHFGFADNNGFVEVNKKSLNSGKWCIPIDTRLITNRPDPAAKDLHTADDRAPSDSSSATQDFTGE